MSLYNSKDIEYMMRLKQAVYHGIQHHSPEQQQSIWETVRKQVTMEDLRIYAIEMLDRAVYFPAMSCHRPVVAVFNKPPMDAELDALHKMMAKLNIHEDHVYVTQFLKVSTEQPDEYNLLHTLLRSELSIVKPEYVLTFGHQLGTAPHQVQDYAGAKLVDSLSLDFQGEPAEVKQKKLVVWEDAKRVFQKAKAQAS